MAWMLRGGKTDRDGPAVADIAVWSWLLVFAIASLLYAAAILSLDLSILNMQVGVLAARLVCCVGTIFGLSRVFHLGRLNVISLVQDVGLFIAVLQCTGWFMDKA